MVDTGTIVAIFALFLAFGLAFGVGICAAPNPLSRHPSTATKHGRPRLPPNAEPLLPHVKTNNSGNNTDVQSTNSTTNSRSTTAKKSNEQRHHTGDERLVGSPPAANPQHTTHSNEKTPLLRVDVKSSSNDDSSDIPAKKVKSHHNSGDEPVRVQIFTYDDLLQSKYHRDWDGDTHAAPSPHDAPARNLPSRRATAPSSVESDISSYDMKDKQLNTGYHLRDLNTIDESDSCETHGSHCRWDHALTDLHHFDGEQHAWHTDRMRQPIQRVIDISSSPTAVSASQSSYQNTAEPRA